MRIIINIGIVLVIAFAVFLLVRKEGMIESQNASFEKKIEQKKEITIPETKSIRITSSEFKDGNHIPYQFTCDGENTNPPLSISEVPKNTKSLALIMNDPDAPGGEWVYWLIWNINPSITEIPKQNIPSHAVQGITDFKKPGYNGPCPLDGLHRYFFTLYSLDVMLDISPSSQKTDLEKAMKGHIISQAQLMGLYARGY